VIAGRASINYVQSTAVIGGRPFWISHFRRATAIFDMALWLAGPYRPFARSGERRNDPKNLAKKLQSLLLAGLRVEDVGGSD